MQETVEAIKDKEEAMITTKIVYDRKKQARKTGDGTIEVRITCDRKSYYISTGIRVREREWKAGMIVNRSDAPALNQRLAVIYEKVCQEANRCIDADEPISTEGIKQKVWAIQNLTNSEPMFFEWVKKQIDEMVVANGTRRQYRTLLKRLTEFDRMRSWQDVTVENLLAFDSWLHQRKKKNGEPLIDSAVFKYHRGLKAMLYRAVMMGKIDRNPYELLKGKFNRGDRENVEYLTEEEMQAIVRLKVTDVMMQRSRDLFVFQMYTGLSWSDAQQFDIGNYREVNGRWISNGERVKTGVPYVSQLLPPVVEVLERYGWKVPRIENHVYNRMLKAIGAMAGINIPLHSHLARHTFATWMLRNGAKIENVSRMLGHTNIKQTQRYAKVLAESVHEEFDRIAKRMGTAEIPQYTEQKETMKKDKGQ